MRPNRIDFIVIGAQKAGTTSLFAHLSAHPEIWVPPEKELDFFSNPDVFGRGVEWYLGEHFSGLPANVVTGEVSPRYLVVPEAAGRIRRTFPDVRLLAILRNPIDRAFSHYRMARKKGAEPRSFEQAVTELISRSDSADPRQAELTEYVAFSRYGRLLTSYYEEFPRERIHIEFLEEFERDPAAAMRRLYAYIGVDDGFRPPGLDKAHNRSGSYRFPQLDRWLRHGTNRPPLSWLTTYRMRQRFYLWLELHNTRPERVEGPATEVRQQLAEHFRDDVTRLERLVGCEVPWPEFRHDEAEILDRR